jgi:hypothetical protein
MAGCETDKNFIFNGDTFVLICWDKGRFLFEEYGVCANYSLISSKNSNIILMRYFSLSRFPPAPSTFDLTAEEIILGKTQKNEKTYEFKKFNETFSISVEVLEQFENMIPFKRRLCQV